MVCDIRMRWFDPTHLVVLLHFSPSFKRVLASVKWFKTTICTVCLFNGLQHSRIFQSDMVLKTFGFEPIWELDIREHHPGSSEDVCLCVCKRYWGVCEESSGLRTSNLLLRASLRVDQIHENWIRSHTHTHTHAAIHTHEIPQTSVCVSVSVCEHQIKSPSSSTHPQTFLKTSKSDATECMR